MTKRKEQMKEAILKDGYDPKDFDCSYMPLFSDVTGGIPIDYNNPKTCSFEELPDHLDSFKCFNRQGNVSYRFDLDASPQLTRQIVR